MSMKHRQLRAAAKARVFLLIRRLKNCQATSGVFVRMATVSYPCIPPREGGMTAKNKLLKIAREKMREKDFFRCSSRELGTKAIQGDLLRVMVRMGGQEQNNAAAPPFLRIFLAVR